jgi:hypothetical protein
MRVEKSARPSRLLRVREFREPAAKPAATPPKNSRSRFVAPYYLDDANRQALEELLAQAGLGDTEGRQLFITALEYEVGTLRPHLPSLETAAAAPTPAPHTKADIELAQVGQTAEHLLSLLQRTPKSARAALGKRLGETDPFAREYGPRYLAQLEQELERIAGACQLPTLPAQEPAPPPISDGAKRLVGQLARIFQECLEVRLQDDALAVFLRLLCQLRESAQLAIPCHAETVAGLLAEF